MVSVPVPDVVFFRQLPWAEVVVGRVSKAELESKVFPVLLYYPELSLTHVHSLVTAVVYMYTADNVFLSCHSLQSINQSIREFI